jgi:hypothetical protein
VSVEAGDGVDGLATLTSACLPAPTVDTDRQAGVREGNPAELVRDAAGLDRAGLAAAVSGGGRRVLDGDVPPGQGGELTVCGRLIGLDHRDVVGLLGLDQPGDVRLDRVRCVEGDKGSVQVQGLQQRLEVRGLVVFVPTSDWARVTVWWWATAESRCRRPAVRRAEPLRALPSTAITRRCPDPACPEASWRSVR